MNKIENITSLVPTNNDQTYSIISLIAASDFFEKLILLILILLSVQVWAIIISKIFSYRSTIKKMIIFENIFWSGPVLEVLYKEVKQDIDNPLAAVFVNAMDEYKKNDDYNNDNNDFLKTGRKERITQAMNLTKIKLITQLEKKLSFLAIVGSSSPFIGLLGTVWGIIHSFQSIASSKNTALTVVAPGISQALIATAIGLLTAIPAVIFFNYLSNNLDNIYTKIEYFNGEFYNLLSRAIDEEKI